MASITGNGSKGHHKFILEVNQTSQNIANNTSTVSFSFKIAPIETTWNWEQWGAYIKYSININGTTYSGNIDNYDGYATVTLKTGSQTVSHNADGSKSISYSFSVTDTSGVNYTSGNASASGTLVLTTIPRASSVSGGSGDIGGATTISISRASASFTHTLKYSFGSLSGTIATGVGTSYKWTIPTSFYAQIPNSNSGTGSITCETYNGSTLIGSKSISFTAKVTNSNPTFTTSNVSYADTNTTVTAITGNNQHIVQNKSNLKVTYTSATGKNSATIKSYSFTLNGVTKTSTTAGGTIDFGVINSANNLTLTATVTDSRGNKTSITKTVTVFAHSNPSALVTLNRLNNYEDETYLTVDGAISSVNSKNKMTIQYRYKVSGGSYGSFTTISDNAKQTLSLNKNNSYIFNIVVTDSFGATYNKEHVLGKGVFPLFVDIEKNSVGINVFPRGNNLLEVDGYILENKREFAIPTTSGEKAGWYLAFSGKLSGYANKAFMLAMQQTFSGGSGVLYINLRCNNSTTIVVEQLVWLTYNGIPTTNVVLKTDGNNFYLYLKTASNYQQYFIKILQEKNLNNNYYYGLFDINKPSHTETVETPTGINPTIKVVAEKEKSIVANENGAKSYIVMGNIMMCWGRVAIAVSSANTPTSISVTFSKTFSNIPNVQVTPVTYKPGTTVLGASVDDITKTGCNIYLTTSTSGSIAVNWFAVGSIE